MSVDLEGVMGFEAVVRLGSFTRAASELGVARSTLSDRVARLENELGVRLLQRTTRSVRATEAGALYYRRCAQIIGQVEEAAREVQALQAVPSGRLRLGSPRLFGRAFLGPLLTRYMKAWPEVKVELFLTDREVNLVEEGFDLAIHIGNLKDSGYVVRHLGPALRYFVASREFLEKHGEPESLASLARWPCVGRETSEVWRCAGEEVKVEPRAVVNSLGMCLDAVKEGLGVGCLPPVLCHKGLASGELVALFEGATVRSGAISLLYPSRHFMAPKVRILADMIAEEVGPLLSRRETLR